MKPVFICAAVLLSLFSVAQKPHITFGESYKHSEIPSNWALIRQSDAGTYISQYGFKQKMFKMYGDVASSHLFTKFDKDLKMVYSVPHKKEDFKGYYFLGCYDVGGRIYVIAEDRYLMGKNTFTYAAAEVDTITGQLKSPLKPFYSMSSKKTKAKLLEELRLSTDGKMLVFTLKKYENSLNSYKLVIFDNELQVKVNTTFEVGKQADNEGINHLIVTDQAKIWVMSYGLSLEKKRKLRNLADRMFMRQYDHNGNMISEYKHEVAIDEKSLLSQISVAHNNKQQLLFAGILVQRDKKKITHSLTMIMVNHQTGTLINRATVKLDTDKLPSTDAGGMGYTDANHIISSLQLTDEGEALFRIEDQVSMSQTRQSYTGTISFSSTTIAMNEAIFGSINTTTSSLNWLKMISKQQFERNGFLYRNEGSVTPNYAEMPLLISGYSGLSNNKLYFFFNDHEDAGEIIGYTSKPKFTKNIEKGVAYLWEYDVNKQTARRKSIDINLWDNPIPMWRLGWTFNGYLYAFCYGSHFANIEYRLIKVKIP